MSKRNRRRNKRSEPKIKEATTAVPQLLGPIGVSPAPDYIFKFRRNRKAPSQEVWGVDGHGTISYAPYKAEYIENEGCFVHYYGEDIPPSKCVAPVQAVHAIGSPKRLFLNAVQFFSTIHKKGRLTRLCDYFNNFAQMSLLPFYMEDGYYCKFVKEIRKAIEAFLITLGVEKSVAKVTGEVLGCFIEYDNAYRIRGQDLAGEADKNSLLKNFPKEIMRLIEIQSAREMVQGGGQQVVQRFKSAAKVLQWIWWIPWTRKAIKNAVKAIDFENCKMDKADEYHTYLYGDYSVKGRSLKERIKILEGIHGTDVTKWPPRVEIKQTGT